MVIQSLPDLFTACDPIQAELSGFRLWWRGHARAHWRLVPSVHRITDRGHYERGVSIRFQARAPARYAGCPAADDHGGWLSLMQHHGLPTRLLDWTESALFALYFAVREPEHDSHDACIWALDPFRLNDHLWKADTQGTVGWTAPAIQPLLNIFARHLPRQGDVAALTPGQTHSRSMVQLSAFTVHATGQPLELHESESAFLRRVEIPSTAKRGLRRGLDSLGICDSYLFPDLESLARDEKARCFCAQQPCAHRKGE